MRRRTADFGSVKRLEGTNGLARGEPENIAAVMAIRWFGRITQAVPHIEHDVQWFRAEAKR
jgi:hypothetical protein